MLLKKAVGQMTGHVEHYILQGVYENDAGTQNRFGFRFRHSRYLSQHAEGIQKHEVARKQNYSGTNILTYTRTHTHTDLQVYTQTHNTDCISELHCDVVCHRFNFSHHLLAGGLAS